MPDINTLIKKGDYDTKIAETETKYVGNTGFDSKLAQANVITKRNFDAKIIELENNIKKLQTFDFSYFRGKSHFEEDGTQNYLVLQPIYKHFKAFSITQYLEYVSELKSKGLSNESIKAVSTSDNSLHPTLSYYGTKIRVKFTGSCLKQSSKLSYTHGKLVNIYIVYDWVILVLALVILQFGAITLTKNADVDKYGYSGYGNGFDRRSSFSFPGTRFGQNVLIFGVDISSSPHIDDKKKTY